MGGCDWDFWLWKNRMPIYGYYRFLHVIKVKPIFSEGPMNRIKIEISKKSPQWWIPRKSSNTQITWEISNISIYGPKQSHKGVMRVSGRRVELISIGGSVRAELANSSLRSLNWLPEWAFTLKKVTDMYLSIIKWSINLHAMLLLFFKIFRIEVSLLLIFWYVSITFENLYKT